eukprot:COSAG02_NODE_13167_length_1434_cov_0.826966_2_plen_394_part_01
MRGLRRLLKRMLSAQLAGAFDAWVDWVEHQKRVHILMHKIARRMSNMTLVSSFRTWVDFCHVSELQALQTQRSDAARNAANLGSSRLLLRIIGRVQCRAFEAWVSCVSRKFKLGQLVRKCIVQSYRTRLAKSFYGWVQELVAVRIRSPQSFCGMKHGSMCMRFLHLHEEMNADMQRALADANDGGDRLMSDLQESRRLHEQLKLRYADCDRARAEYESQAHEIQDALHAAGVKIAEADARAVHTVDQLKELLRQKQIEEESSAREHQMVLEVQQAELERMGRANEGWEERLRAERKKRADVEHALAAEQSAVVLHEEYELAVSQTQNIGGELAESKRKVAELAQGLNALTKQCVVMPNYSAEHWLNAFFCLRVYLLKVSHDCVCAAVGAGTAR